MGTLFLRGASEEVSTINEMRWIVRDQRNAFGQPIVTFAAGRPREGGITLTLDDLEHLLIDAGRDGWLNGEIIEAALRLHARDVPAYVMPRYLHSCAHGSALGFGTFRHSMRTLINVHPVLRDAGVWGKRENPAAVALQGTPH